jgi:phosphonate transport system permease protein
MSPQPNAQLSLHELKRRRPRERLVQITLLLLVLLTCYAWTCGDIHLDDLDLARRTENLERFVQEDLAPYSLRDQEHSWTDVAAWAWTIAVTRGFEGALQTLAMATVAITLSAMVAFLLLWCAARTSATARPYGDGRGRETLAWRVVRMSTIALFVYLRAIPEYIWAFLLVAMLGPSAWPLILALAIHNSGILGRLGAETVENLPPRPLTALRTLGATRTHIGLFAATPGFLSRFLLYVFYRYETCVREATVLGMLGIASLGYWIEDVRTKRYYDEMVLLVAMGALLVLCVDLLSAWVRRRLRQAS